MKMKEMKMVSDLVARGSIVSCSQKICGVCGCVTLCCRYNIFVGYIVFKRVWCLFDILLESLYFFLVVQIQNLFC